MSADSTTMNVASTQSSRSDIVSTLAERFSRQTLDIYYMDWNDCPEHVKPLKAVVEQEINRYIIEKDVYNSFDEVVTAERSYGQGG